MSSDHMPEMDDNTKKMIMEFQNNQQQLQGILIQKESLKIQNMEINRALEELEKTNQTSAYKIAGQIMISKPIKELKDEMNEIKETIDLRAKSLEKSEERISNKLKELQEKLKEVIK